MKIQIALMATLVVLLSLTMGTVGFSVLEVDNRDANVQVAANDTAGLLVLDPGATDVVNTDSNGQLQVDLSQAINTANTQAEGVNPNSRLEIGDKNDIQNKPAFTATNGYTGEVTLDFTLEVDENVGSSYTLPGEVVLHYNDGSGAQKITLSDASTAPSGTLTLGQGGSADYTLEFNTDQGASLDDYRLDLSYTVTPT